MMDRPRSLVLVARAAAVAVAVLLAGCSSDAATPLVAPTGVFTRTDTSEATPFTVTLVFQSGKGVRFSRRSEGGVEVTERSCFS